MRVRALAIAGLSSLLLTACGGTATDATSASGTSASAAETRPASDIAAEAADALETAGSVHVQGAAASEGVDALDLRLHGDDVSGSITMGGQTMQILQAAGTTYVQADAEFWTANGVPVEAVSLVDGVWVLLPADAGADFSPVSLSGIAGEIRALADPALDQDVTTDQLDGQDVLVLTQADGSTLHVAATGSPYPLQVTDPAGSLTLTEFGEQQPIAAPASFVDLAQLGA
jgi:hypothetical protein